MDNVNLTDSVRSNLYELQKSSNLTDRTSNRLATGKSVNSPLDDPINYFSALQNSNQVSDLDARKNEVSEAIQTIKAADNGLNAINDLTSTARSIADSAKSITGTDAESITQRNKLAGQFNEVLAQIDTIAKDSGYKGVNLLDGANLEVPFNEGGSATLTVEGVNANTQPGGDLEIAAPNNWDSVANVDTSLANLDSAVSEIRNQQKALSSDLGTIATRNEFTLGKTRILQTGADNLTTADLNEEAANLLALQTRQQLGTSSLNIASQAAQSVLKLF